MELIMNKIGSTLLESLSASESLYENHSAPFDSIGRSSESAANESRNESETRNSPKRGSSKSTQTNDSKFLMQINQREKKNSIRLVKLEMQD